MKHWRKAPVDGGRKHEDDRESQKTISENSKNFLIVIVTVVKDVSSTSLKSLIRRADSENKAVIQNNPCRLFIEKNTENNEIHKHIYLNLHPTPIWSD